MSSFYELKKGSYARLTDLNENQYVMKAKKGYFWLVTTYDNCYHYFPATRAGWPLCEFCNEIKK